MFLKVLVPDQPGCPGYHHHHHIRFWYLRCCGCPGLRGRQHLTLVLHEFLSNGLTPSRLTPSRLHIVISFLTHADHVFLGLPRSLVPGSPNRVMELMHKVARCTCPYHLRRRVRRTAVISSSKPLNSCRVTCQLRKPVNQPIAQSHCYSIGYHSPYLIHLLQTSVSPFHTTTTIEVVTEISQR